MDGEVLIPKSVSEDAYIDESAEARVATGLIRMAVRIANAQLVTKTPQHPRVAGCLHSYGRHE